MFHEAWAPRAKEFRQPPGIKSFLARGAGAQPIARRAPPSSFPVGVLPLGVRRHHEMDIAEATCQGGVLPGSAPVPKD